MANKEEILDYVMNSPQNTNPAVLGNMLGNLEGGGSSEIITIDYTEGVVLGKKWGNISHDPSEVFEKHKKGVYFIAEEYDNDVEEYYWYHICCGSEGMVYIYKPVYNTSNRTFNNRVHLIGHSDTEYWEQIL